MSFLQNLPGGGIPGLGGSMNPLDQLPFVGEGANPLQVLQQLGISPQQLPLLNLIRGQGPFEGGVPGVPPFLMK